MARSLYRRIYMHFLALLVAVAAMSSWVFIGSWPGALVADGTSRFAVHIGRLLVAAPNPTARHNLAVSLGDELDLDLALYDMSGKLVASRGKLLPAVQDLSTIDTPTLRSERSSWFVAAKVVPADEPAFVLECVPAQVNMWGVPMRKVLALCGLLVLISLVVRPLARRISMPVERIIDASRRFGEGDLSVRVKMPHMHHWHRKWHRRWDRHVWRGDELSTLMFTWNDMAERIERQVGQQRELLANVSHELRSPLARVRVALALLPDDDKTRKRIADIEADLGELDTLIEEILQTSRLEAGGLPSHDARFSLAALYDEVLARASADPLTATLDIKLDPDARPTDEFINGDRALLRRALFNLVENAAKYGAAPVTLGCSTTADGIDLCVSDHGPGVPEKERARMLRPFMRGDLAHTPGRGGVGLGLSFATRVAAVHGGALTLEDAAGGGLRVRIHLPTKRIA